MSAGKRFVQLSTGELEELMQVKVAKNTSASTRSSVRTFMAFCKETGILAEEQLDTVEKTKLKDILFKFYAGCRTEKENCIK